MKKFKGVILLSFIWVIVAWADAHKNPPENREPIGCGMSQGYNISSADLVPSKFASSVEDCCAYCKDTPGCVAAVFLNYYCYLKNKTTPLIESEGCTAIYLPTPAPATPAPTSICNTIVSQEVCVGFGECSWCGPENVSTLCALGGSRSFCYDLKEGACCPATMSDMDWACSWLCNTSAQCILDQQMGGNDTCCPQGQSSCYGFYDTWPICCSDDHVCCGDHSSNSQICCPPDTTCCYGDTFSICCPLGQVCCTDNSDPQCCPEGQHCNVSWQCTAKSFD